MRGVYTLILRVNKPTAIRIGALGILRFRAGTYVYVGSGLGRNASSVEGRIARHLGMRKKNHWHIDYLLGSARVTLLRVAYAITRRHVECGLAEHLSYGRPSSCLYVHFGSSDCNCRAHLLFMGRASGNLVLALVRNAYRSLDLNFRHMP